MVTAQQKQIADLELAMHSDRKSYAKAIRENDQQSAQIICKRIAITFEQYQKLIK